MTDDPIIDEIRLIRDEICREHDYDLKKIFGMLKKMENDNALRHVTRQSSPSSARRIDEQSAGNVGHQR